MTNKPDYIKIFSDIILKKFPEKRCYLKYFIEKKDLSTFEVIKLNREIFGDSKNNINQKHKAYKKSDIVNILSYQRQNNLNNSQLAFHFKISRNTITKWKKKYL